SSSTWPIDVGRCDQLRHAIGLLSVTVWRGGRRRPGPSTSGALATVRRYGLLPFVAYLLLATVTTRPLIGQLGGTLVLGTESAATVPLFTTWTVWWNADRASHRFAGFWDAPIFYPESDTLAF